MNLILKGPGPETPLAYIYIYCRAAQRAIGAVGVDRAIVGLLWVFARHLLLFLLLLSTSSALRVRRIK